jgi:hypothetical protein
VMLEFSTSSRLGVHSGIECPVSVMTVSSQVFSRKSAERAES